MNFNKKYYLIMLIVAFVAYAAWAFTDSVTPYVGIAAARTAKQSVQVKGLLNPAAQPPHQEGSDFVFGLMDEETGETMTVRYHGEEPDRFKEAHHIVAIGTYANDKDAFVADKLLIKCPSKYEKQK